MFKSWDKVKRLKDINNDGHNDLLIAKSEVEKVYQKHKNSNVINNKTQEFYENQMTILKGVKAKIESEYNTMRREWKV